MPYAQRDQDSSTYFHVFSRGADRQDIFCLDGDQSIFERLVAEMVERFAVDIHAYAWMSNHVHLLLHAPQGNLSEAMQFLLGTYARTFNVRTGRSGPVFDRRFGSVPIVGDGETTAEAHFAIAARYIHRNPLAIVAPEALAAYPHASLAPYLGLSSAPGWLTTSELGAMIDPATYLDDVTTVRSDDLLPVADLDPLVAVSIVDLADEVEIVARSKGVADDDARLLQMTLAVELRIDRHSSIAEHFGVAIPSVRRAARRGRVRLASDAGFDALRRRVLAGLAQRRRERTRSAIDAVRFQPEVKRIQGAA